MLGYWIFLISPTNATDLTSFHILGQANKGKHISAIIWKSHDNEVAEDVHLLALLQRSVWHQQIPTFGSLLSSKQVSLYPFVRKQDFSKTCWPEKKGKSFHNFIRTRPDHFTIVLL